MRMHCEPLSSEKHHFELFVTCVFARYLLSLSLRLPDLLQALVPCSCQDCSWDSGTECVAEAGAAPGRVGEVEVVLVVVVMAHCAAALS